MKLYGHFFSAPANFTRLTASAVGLDHDYVHVDLMKGEQKTPEFMAISQFGKVPALQDGDFVLCESGAITRYIASQSENAIYPADLKQRARIDQWIDFSNQHVRMAMAKILFNKFFAPMMDIPVDDKSIEEGKNLLDGQLPQIEGTLSKSSYLTGENLTLGDISMIAAMEPFEMIGVSLEDYAAITKWRQGVMATDWYQNVHAHYGAEMS